METYTNRIVAFSDALFAIALTLLILDVKVPGPEHGYLTRALIEEWPEYLAFLLTFFYVGVMWMNHHRMFTYIRRSDNILMILNLFLLLGVTIAPFPAAVLAANLGTSNQKTASVFYNAVFLVIAICFRALWYYATKRQLLDENVPAAATRMISRQYTGGPLMFATCSAVAFFDVRVSLSLNLALAIYFALPPSIAGRNLFQILVSPSDGSEREN